MITVTENRKDNIFWVLIIFLINPLLSLIVSLRDYLSPYSKNLVWLFCAFYGLTFSPVRNSMDSYRHREDFVMWTEQRELNFDSFVEKLYSDDVKYVDVFMPVLKFVVSRFTDSPNYFYGILGILFGYFYSRNIWFLIDYFKIRLNKYAILCIFIFAFIVPPWEINSFRFWIATHIFVYCIFRILLKKSKIAYLGLLFTPFIHFGYIFSLVLFALYKLIGNRLHVYFIIFVAAILLNEVNLSAIQNAIPKSSISALDKKTSSYTSEGYISERQEGTRVLNWYVTLKGVPLKYTTILLIIFIYIKYRRELKSSPLLPLVCFALFAFGISHALMNSVPVFGRYNRMALLLVYSFIFIIVANQKNIKWYNKIYPLHLISALFFIIIDIRAGFDTITIDTVISNPIISLLYQSNESIITFIK